jgi:hypothetical protein
MNGRQHDSCVAAQIYTESGCATTRFRPKNRTKTIHRYHQMPLLLVVNAVATTIAKPPHMWANAGTAFAAMQTRSNCENVRLRRTVLASSFCAVPASSFCAVHTGPPCIAPDSLCFTNSLVESAHERDDAAARCIWLRSRQFKLPTKVSDAVRTVRRNTNLIVHRGYTKLLRMRASWLEQESAQPIKEEEKSYVVADK